MNLMDIILLALFVPGLIRGLTKGLVEQGISLVGAVAAVYLAYHYRDWAAAWLQQYIGANETVLLVLGFVAILAVTLVAAILLAKLISKVVEMVSLGWLNKILGVVFAVLLSAIVIGLLLIVFDTLNAKFQLVKPELLDNSILYGPMRELGNKVFPYLQQWMHPIA